MKNLLICISFYYKKERYKYLNALIKNFLSYDVDLDIIIDTNNKDAINLIYEEFSKEKIKIFVHDNLENNFFLTWKHRQHFKNNILKYKNFYYTEDDIYLSFKNYKNYILEFSRLWPNYIPSFVRIESYEKDLYHTDSYVKTFIDKNDIVKIQDQIYVSIHNSYHGFWIMPQEALLKCLNEKFCQPIHSEKTREIAASFGLQVINLKRNKSKLFVHINNLLNSNDIKKEGLLKLEKYKYEISDTSYSFHLPNNYIHDKKYNLAKIKIQDVVKFKKIL
jgi:hypothetical protein